MPQYRDFSDKIGCPELPNLQDCLKDKTLKEINDAQLMIKERLGLPATGPVIDGQVLPGEQGTGCVCVCVCVCVAECPLSYAYMCVCLSIVNRTNWLCNSASFFVIGFCSLFPLFVGLDRAQNTKGFQMHMNN